MELRHLRYFVAVGEEEHFGRAAQRLSLAQPALSRQIQDLEREIGFKLFDRLSRGVKISSAGRLFLEESRRILQQLTEATERAQRVARGRPGTLRIGFTEKASWRGVVPDSLHFFREHYPDAELVAPSERQAALHPTCLARVPSVAVPRAAHSRAGATDATRDAPIGWRSTRRRSRVRCQSDPLQQPRPPRIRVQWAQVIIRQQAVDCAVRGGLALE